MSEQTASMEDYLEAIALLDAEDKGATVTAISQMLRVKKPSVTAALTRLSVAKLVNHQKYGRVGLTEEGRHIAQDVYQRHQMLHRFLTEVLGVEEKTAAEDACKLEHNLSPTSVKKLAQYIRSIGIQKGY